MYFMSTFSYYKYFKECWKHAITLTFLFDEPKTIHKFCIVCIMYRENDIHLLSHHVLPFKLNQGKGFKM